jgi:hypothetical protein
MWRSTPINQSSMCYIFVVLWREHVSCICDSVKKMSEISQNINMSFIFKGLVYEETNLSSSHDIVEILLKLALNTNQSMITLIRY